MRLNNKTKIKKSTRNKFNRSFRSIFFLMLSVSIVYLLVHSPLLNIRDYNIKLETKDNVLVQKMHGRLVNLLNKETYKIKHNFYYFVHRSKLKQELEKIKWVKHVNIEYKFFNIFDIYIEKKQEFLEYCKTECFLVDRTGHVFLMESEYRKAYFDNTIYTLTSEKELTLGDSILDEERMNKLFLILQFLNSHDIELESVVYGDGFIELIETKTPIYINLDKTAYQTTRALYIALFELPDKNLALIDVRDPLKPRYKK